MKKFNKERFLKTDFGQELKNCVECWDKWIEEHDQEAADRCAAQWEVYKMALWQFFGIEYYFTRTSEYFGVVTEDERDWLFKIERQL